MSAKLFFYGGTGTVTGANFMLDTGRLKILIDCGLLQGVEAANESNRVPFEYNPADINFLFVTHAHMDHIGRIPKLVKDGFRGVIYSTPETRALAEVMLQDALGLITREAAETKQPALYEDQDLITTFTLWKTLAYHTPLPLGDMVQVKLLDAGHILGSAMVEFDRYNKRIVCTGDLGNSPTPLLNDTEDLENPTWVLTESVYGNRNHEHREERRDRLASAIKRAMHKRGTLLIPSFSLEKTQVLLSEINDLLQEKRIEKCPIYLDSPLAVSVTSIYRQMNQNYNPATQERTKKGDDPFDFPGLRIVSDRRESLAIGRTPNPKIIIAGSGMSTGGRIVQHERDLLSSAKNTILFIGYQSAGTLGRRIADGEKKLEIMGEQIKVRASVDVVHGYSSHKDSQGIVDWLERSDQRETLKEVFVVMGESKASLFLAQKIKNELGVKAENPDLNSSRLLDF